MQSTDSINRRAIKMRTLTLQSSEGRPFAAIIVYEVFVAFLRGRSLQQDSCSKQILSSCEGVSSERNRLPIVPVRPTSGIKSMATRISEQAGIVANCISQHELPSPPNSDLLQTMNLVRSDFNGRVVLEGQGLNVSLTSLVVDRQHLHA
eukprot:3453770-Amphidinium_carterae.1